MKNKFISIVLVLVLISTMCTAVISVSAQTSGEPTIILDSVETQKGNEVAVKICVENNPGIWGMDIKIAYDRSDLTLISVDNGDFFQNSEWTKGDLEADTYILSYEAGGFDDITSKSGVLAVLNFKVSDNPSSEEYDITASYYPGDCINVDFEDIKFNIINGRIKILEFESATTEPTTAEPTTVEPTTDEQTTVEPTTVEPTTAEPTTVEPTTVEPTTAEPTTTEPTTAEPTTAEPTTVEPTTAEPTTVEPTTAEPTTVESTTAETTTVEPTTAELTTVESTTVKSKIETTTVKSTEQGSGSPDTVTPGGNGVVQTGSANVAFVLSVLLVISCASIGVFVYFRKNRNN